MPTYTIIENNRENLEKLVTKFAKRAARNGLAPITVAFGAPRIEEREKIVVTEGEGESFEGQPMRHTVRERVCLIDVTVEGEPPRLPGGYSLVGTVEHNVVDGAWMNLVNPAPEREMPLDARTAAPTCDHCGKARRRSTTVVVQAEDGTLKRIGKSCVALYLPGVDVDALLAFMAAHGAIQAELEGGSDDDEFGGYRAPRVEYIDDVLAAGAAVRRLFGWVTAKTASDTNEASSASHVANLLGKPDKYQARLVRDMRDAAEKAGEDTNVAGTWWPVNDADKAAAVEIRAWMKDGVSGRNDYRYNLAVLAAGDTFDANRMAMVVSAVGSFYNEQDRIVERKAQAAAMGESQHVGSLKQRLNLELSLLTCRAFSHDDLYGTRYLVKFVDRSGNQFAWFTGRPVEMARDEFHVVRATVKAHTEFKGVKETTITRADVGAKVEAVAA